MGAYNVAIPCKSSPTSISKLAESIYLNNALSILSSSAVYEKRDVRAFEALRALVRSFSHGVVIVFKSAEGCVSDH